MTTRETKTPGIPDIREDNVLDVLRAIKSTIEVREGRSGDPLDQGATLRDLTDLGLADPDGKTDSPGGGTLPVGPIGGGPGDGYDPGKDLTTPPAPLNLAVVGGFAALYLTWDGAPYRNHAYTEVWRNVVDALDTSVLVGTSISSGYTDPAEPDTEYWYWVRFVSRANVKGPWNSTSGTPGRTAIDVEKVIKALSDEMVRSGLMQELSQRIDKINADAYIAGRAVESSLEKLETRIDTNSSRLLELHSVTATQATSIQVLESKGASGNRTFFSDNRPDASVNGVVAGTALILNDIWYDTNDNNRSYKWTSPGQWVEFVVAGVKVYHQPGNPASFNGTNWVDSTGRLMLQGDLWYDSDDADHSYFWSSATNAWTDNTAVDNTAEIITLEQTKIGYATLVATCQYGPINSVFDAGGVIWNNVDSTDPLYGNSAKKWNVDHTLVPTEQVLWHVGIPFAQSVKQVGITTTTGGTAFLQNKMEAYQKNDDTLLAQYTVKLDVNGYVAGFGLASWTNTDLTHASSFIVNADKFAIGPAYPSAIWNAGVAYAKNDTVKMTGGTPPVVHVFQARQAIPANSGHTPTWGKYRVEDDEWWTDLSVRLPFIATTTSVLIDGHTYPPGVWMPTANIADASIVSAKIGSLVADKITSGTIVSNTSISVNGWIYGGVNPNYGIPGAFAGNGFFLGVQGGNYKFFVGNADTDYVYWQGSTFEVKGRIIATSGSIAGINMAGGQLYTTGTWWQSGNGFFLDALGHMWMGSDSGHSIEWNGSSLTIKGTINAESGTFAGSLSAVGGTFHDLVLAGTNPYLSSGITWQPNPIAISGNGFLSGFASDLGAPHWFVGRVNIGTDRYLWYDGWNLVIQGDIVQTGNIKNENVTAIRTVAVADNTSGGTGTVRVIDYRFTLAYPASVTLLFIARHDYQNNGCPHQYSMNMDGVNFMLDPQLAANSDYVSNAFSWDAIRGTQLSAGEHHFEVYWNGSNSNIHLKRASASFTISYR